MARSRKYGSEPFIFGFGKSDGYSRDGFVVIIAASFHWNIVLPPERLNRKNPVENG